MKRILGVSLAVVLLSMTVGCASSPPEAGVDSAYADWSSAADDMGYVESEWEEPKNDDYYLDYDVSSKSEHEHFYISSVTKEATCGEEGVTTYRCSCGASYTEPISKTSAHDWEYATCTSPDRCKICGTTRGEPQGHSYSSDGKCYRCGAVNPVVTNTLAKCSLALPSLPAVVSYYSSYDKLYSSVKVTNITYQFKCDNDGRIDLELFFSGEKTYDYRGSGQSDSCKIGWKLYGPDGSVIRSDTFYSPSLQVGETFSNKSEDALYSFDNGAPGQYRLEISNVN